MKLRTLVEVALPLIVIIVSAVGLVMMLSGCEPVSGPTEPCQPAGCTVPASAR